MAKRFRIRCINKVPRNNPYERITHVGGFGTSQWKLTVSEVIRRIKSGEEAFYVERPTGDQVEVIVAVSRNGNEYIKTTADGDEPNNLLSLPECP
ncbi:DUF3892 domain-containing protein [Phyllobacterium phragmitis]|uniref:DUF3892 domain-containing protein n=1 Tax=Phyllobacterium phragmitis TaxID=2670329 RepID=A0A2S9IIM0_9HYPH|nr:DUF3892 domain-containing protein [Phyllobacterium phragmitis]PRD40380.1 DUF3892 domain-containing protein [Phyllobacterium phragmitis]